MSLKFRYSLLLAITVFLLLAFTEETPYIQFVTPKGWPQPVYDFSKNKPSDEKYKLGRHLFYDPVLSRDSSTSCSSCHLQFSGFTHVDHALSHGINGLKGTRNSLTLFNLAWSKNFMWDGGVNNLEVQPINPITNPVEMDQDLPGLIKKLNASAYYRQRFYKAFGDSVITSQKLLKALAQYMVMLESYNSRYDKVMRHETGAVFTDAEQHGYELFKMHCASCHAEPLFTNRGFENNGLPVDTELRDIGRMKITGLKSDSLKFKVPSLRNCELSYPYMHDGRFRNLDMVLTHYTQGITISQNLSPALRKPVVMNDSEKKDLIAFLKTLTDKEFMYDLRYRNYLKE
ncbi:MAG: c-type cytochrome [Bacteroidetes bacterium]|nr:c-type cytochrome [Bacteroidota bacterium]